MVSSGSVTLWIDRLQAGDPDAAQQLWERYFRRLVGLARHKLPGRPRAAADEEDVAESAFDSFCRAQTRAASRNYMTATTSGSCWWPSRPTRPWIWCAAKADGSRAAAPCSMRRRWPSRSTGARK